MSYTKLNLRRRSDAGLSYKDPMIMKLFVRPTLFAEELTSLLNMLHTAQATWWTRYMLITAM